LAFVANATIEILSAFRVPPERDQTRWQLIVDKLRNRAVDALHHGGQTLAKP
jgi:hypothetical protein